MGAIRRVQISNINITNMAGRFAALITGVPGHDIEDLHISNVQIQYPGGVTLCKPRRGPRSRRRTIPSRRDFGGCRRMDFHPARHGDRSDGYRHEHAKEDMRPAYYLDDVKDVDLTHIKAPHAPGRPNIVLHNVDDLSIHQYRGIADTQRDHVEHEEF